MKVLSDKWRLRDLNHKEMLKEVLEEKGEMMPDGNLNLQEAIKSAENGKYMGKKKDFFP